jgi:hypothetical protein
MRELRRSFVSFITTDKVGELFANLRQAWARRGHEGFQRRAAARWLGKEVVMSIENAIRIIAGTFVLVSVALAHWVSEWWLLLSVFVAVNLIQSAFTGFCPPEILLRKFGLTNARCKDSSSSQTNAAEQ